MKLLPVPLRPDPPRGLAAVLARRPLTATLGALGLGAGWILAVDALGAGAPARWPGGLASWGLLALAGIALHLLLERLALAGGGAGPAVDELPEAVLALDPQGRLLGWNRRAALAAGLTAGWFGRPLAEAIPAADQAAFAAALATARAGGGAAVAARLRGPDGTSAAYRWLIAARPGGGLVASGRPAAAESPADAADPGEAFRTAVATAPHLVALVAGERILYLNPAGARLLGQDEAALPGAPLALRPAADGRHRLICADGSAVPVAVTSAPVEHDGLPALLVQARDLRAETTAAEAALAAERQLRTVLDLTAEAVVAADSAGRVLWLNRAAETLFGPAPEGAGGLAAMLGHLPAADGPTRLRRRDGTVFTAECRLGEVLLGDGRILIAAIGDTTARTAAQHRAALAEAVMEVLAEGVMVTDRQGVIEWVNGAFCGISGYPREEVVGAKASLLKSGLQQPAFYREMWSRLRSQGEWTGEIWNRRKDGEAYPEWLSIKAVRDDAGSVVRYLGVFSDISKHKRAEETIKLLTYYDTVTRLPNRYLFRDRLGQAIERATRSGRLVGVVATGLDRFKTINESLGHTSGDALLREVADRLTGSVRGQDTVARLRGDSFYCVLTDLAAASDAHPVVSRIIDGFTASFSGNGQEVYLTASVGVALYPIDATDPEELVQKAEAAMTRSKQKAEGPAVQFYTPEMNANSLQRLRLETDLRKAVPAGELVLHYQPKVATATGRIMGAEALVRWQHHEFGMIAPARFIPMAEETGLIIPVGQWVLAEACRQIRHWIDQGLPPVRTAVNLSAHQFRQPDLIDGILRELERCALDPGLLEIELTESAVMVNPEQAARVLAQLHDLGVRVAIDDFGTGYSSLSQLRRFPLDHLKIDRSFIQDLCASSADEEIVAAIIAMAHSLNLRVVAEGVETEEQRARLLGLGCDQIQGYYFSPPVPAARFAEMVEAGVLTGRAAA